MDIYDSRYKQPRRKPDIKIHSIMKTAKSGCVKTVSISKKVYNTL